MAKKKSRVVIASAADIKTHSVSSQGGRTQLKQTVTGHRGAVQGRDESSTLSSFFDTSGAASDIILGYDSESRLEEVKETKKSKRAGIKVDAKPRNLISVSNLFQYST
jgi:hypothetical protein